MNQDTFSRRGAVGTIAAITAGAAWMTTERAAAAAAARPVTGMGVVMYDCGIRRGWMKRQAAGVDLFEPMTFMRHCRSLGAGGAQVALKDLPTAQCDRLRQYVSDQGMYLESITSPPKDDADLDRFDAEIRAARDAGALAVRTVIIPGRRYEHFKSYEAFKQSARRGHEMVRRAIPVVEKHGVPLAIENHKDERIDDRVALLQRINHPLIGACVDTGNSFSLLDDVYGAIEALAPFAHSVHFKDQSLGEYEEGFLLGDIALGRGSFDMKRIVDILRAHRPDQRFSLEVITRDPLPVPCLTKDYWKTVSEPTGFDLARSLTFVRQHTAEAIRVGSLPIDQQVAAEDLNVAESLRYAAQELRL